MAKPRRVERKESKIVLEIGDWLHENHYFFWRSNNIAAPQLNARGDIRFRAMPKYALKGLPDIFVVHKGKFIGFEVKSEKGIWREEQKKFADCFSGEGGLYYVVRSLDEVRHLLEI